jgi:enoyl-CoA hydratase
VSDDPLVLVERDGAVGICTLNRPERRNALTTPLLEALVAALGELDGDPAIRSIVLRGAGKAFAAGADIDELARISGLESRTGHRRAQWNAIQRRPKPVVAAVHGYALGAGCELALACDIVLAADDARFGLPETGLGIIPGAGGTQRLVRAVGKAVALEVILAGRLLTAGEAVASGLAARSVPPDELAGAALAVAHEIARRSPIAIGLARAAVARSLDVTLEAGLVLERDAFAIARASADAAEGIAAFREKRTPRFEGR